MNFLGHIVTADGIRVDPAKVEAIQQWKSPTTPNEIHRGIFKDSKANDSTIEEGSQSELDTGM